MSRLIVRNIGPIKDVDIDLKKVNVFIGAQSSGKSTLAKIISFCTWLDKHTDNATKMYVNGAIRSLMTYHRLTKEYFSNKSTIFYQGDNIVYVYNWPKCEALPDEVKEYESPVRLNNKEIFFEKTVRVSNPKVLYIPAERNFVSAVPNLRKYQEDKDNLQEFVNTWFEVKRKFPKDKALDVLNLGFQYYYQEDSYRDYVILEDGKTQIPLESSSSGLQSIIPLLVLVKWMSEGIYDEDKPFSPAENEEIEKIVLSGLADLNKQDASIVDKLDSFLGFLSGRIYTHTQFIIEEPEQNLFPETQCELMYHILSAVNHGKNHRLVMTTHSPYVLYALNNCMDGFSVSDKLPENLKSTIKSASSFIDPDDVNIWQIRDGKLESIKEGDSVGQHYFNEIMNSILDDYYKIQAYK